MKSLLIRLAASNRLAKEYAERLMGKRKYRDFRKAISKFAASQPVEDDLQAKIESIPAEDLAIICDAESLVPDLVIQIKHLAIKVAVSVASRFNNAANNCDLDNLCGQSQVYLLYAIYGYSNPNVKLSTYAYHVVKNELDRYVLMHHTGLSSNSMDLVDTKRDWLRAEQELMQQEVKPSFHNVADHLGYDNRDRKKLMGVMASIGSIHYEEADHHTGESCLVRPGIEQYQKDQQANAANETCDLIESQVLTGATERTIFRAMRSGQSLMGVARSIGLDVKEARKIFERIKAKTRRFYTTFEKAA